MLYVAEFKNENEKYDTGICCMLLKLRMRMKSMILMLMLILDMLVVPRSFLKLLHKMCLCSFLVTQ